ncbi:uncharacterized protein LACBIDRAFT_297396 [Laccaria bicolor S238N-H82]|uniref:Predicted protein n=1 Tax=Laccaria bicolor (strain S238N-H82 / ATCC MYA-4686) TaxID=486041 RepID=B0DAN8_LACBS|nr:uncharacterized protein LACBIDRAFT_297396 [Laccaria bicolor S238N-H82]EDR08782.1 predicted protein [Laccaria bicolor S238N-H82]|eukprot:XP_001881007.1 predicted protein [Laccaria bicolor S238N-H82]
MRKTPKGKHSKSSSKVSSKKTDISDSSSRGTSDEMDVELDSSPLSKKSIPYGKEFDKSIAKAKKMLVDNKKAMSKLGKEIADDEAEIEKYEESGKEGSDGDDDDLPSEGKKKHIKKSEVLLEDLVRDPVPSYPKLRKCGIFKAALVNKFMKTCGCGPVLCMACMSPFCGL